jgi:hypothetical protein
MSQTPFQGHVMVPQIWLNTSQAGENEFFAKAKDAISAGKNIG